MNQHYRTVGVPRIIRRRGVHRFNLRNVVLMLFLAIYSIFRMHASNASDIPDTLERAVLPPDDADVNADNRLHILGMEQFAYDNNVFSLPPTINDVRSVAGPNASKEDHINTTSAGLDGIWSIGNQFIDLGVRADENRFTRNDDLNNTSTSDHLIWDWQVGPKLSGEVGADYNRYLASFIDSTYYFKNMYERSEYFGAARFQAGPHWGVFAGILDSASSLSASVSGVNTYHTKSVDTGVDFAGGGKNTFGMSYRYTDARDPESVTLNGATFLPDYREDRIRGFIKYELSDKTLIDASAGYLKRSYPSTAIGSFAGDVWHVSLQWQPSDKTKLIVEAMRDLESYLTNETDYFVATGGSLAPAWVVSEKVTLSVEGSWRTQAYIGSMPDTDSHGSRRDVVTGQKASLLYAPLQSVTVNLSYGNEQRNSNQAEHEYKDRIVKASVTARF